ncbi:hypothetical protein [Mannheimia haemolytica]|uniref:hypothetical protein n=1 Tax=Mannheimia haemolytica TaxID=75985 RepID=UPI0001BCFE1D|nr:hypothetical protein [Mannheimia haemolytica]AGI35451.1 hypothetical protein D648_14470 [Mannheimia haemolytica USDA-ARS-USMARC-185]AJE08858.1 hypothetical protein B824_20630 [Mannheimia haemolytica USDA-ARS-USMARC-184]EEY10965.1 hypothetical protein COI_0416 [Mannheimia haemolytica serotype A2 str. OVINE]EEY12928.1 hypothetical protein COK_1043 [Mannheimia haemolytica serotype A2 str. BOVINE]KYL06402.1 hypothetical protein AC568_10855 [Mannheimia haemolytica]
MEAVFAYLLVGSVIFMLITFAFTGFAWVASAIVLILSALVSPFVLVARLFIADKTANDTEKQAIMAYHQAKYGTIEKIRK